MSNGEQMLEIDMEDPMKAGAKMGGDFLGGIIGQFDTDMSDADAVLLWVGIMASLSGLMAARLGHDNARHVIDQVRGCVDRMEAEIGAKPVVVAPQSDAMH